MDIIVDASVTGKWFFTEPLQEKAKALLDPRYRFVAPDLLASEFLNIVQKKTSLQIITPDFGVNVLNRFQQLPIHYIPTLDLLDEAYQISSDLSHSAYDCIYLAIPIKQGGIMVTADKPFYQKVKSSSYANLIIWIEDTLEISS